MKCLIPFILAVVLVAAEGKVIPESDGTQESTATPDPFKDIKNYLLPIFGNLSSLIQHIPNQDEVFNTFKQQSTSLVNNMNEYIKNATDEIKAKSPELENFWTSFKSKLSETVNKLNVDAETSEQLNQLNAKFQEGVQTILTESENTAKAINENSAKVQEGISKFTKQAIDIAVQASQNLSNHLQATTPHP